MRTVLLAAQHAVELHGGNGMMLDFGVEKLFRDAAIFPHMDGTADISKFKVSQSLGLKNGCSYIASGFLTYSVRFR